MSRPVGTGERIATIQHFLGYYCCVCITARYTLNGDVNHWKDSLEEAICKTIIRHPILCAGIEDHDTNNPVFVRLDAIDLSHHIEYKHIPDEGYDRSLERVLSHKHSERFRDLACRPAWKLIIVQRDTTDSSKVEFDAIFAFHHVLGDGKSGFVFHASMLEALNSHGESVKLERGIFQIPKSIIFPLPIEEQIDFRISWSFYLKTRWNHLDLIPAWMRAPAPWVSTPCLSKVIQNYSSRVKIISVDADQLSRILLACRAQRTTVTGLMSALIVACLTKGVPESESFVGCIPYSLRHLLGPSARNEIGSYVSGLVVKYLSTMTSILRSSAANERVSEEIWNIARVYMVKMASKLAHIPNDLECGMMPFVEDPTALFRACIDRPRRTTFEASNVGVFHGNRAAEKWCIKRMLFSQSGQGIEAAICFSSASVVGGPLVIGVSWLEGAIGEELVEKLSSDLEHGLNGIGEGGIISFG